LNYRHAFHAGNFADCMKHALLVRQLRGLTAKPKGFAVLDTHAGAGANDLSSAEAVRTGEWQRGIGRLHGITEGPLADYVTLAGSAGQYPGSPSLIRALLRPQDRLMCCELHPADADSLRLRFRRDPQVAIHVRDGWEAVKALTPFAEKRGLVLIDPPFEQPGEFERLSSSIMLLAHRFRAAVQACWYPIKHRAPVRAFHDALRASGVRDLITTELWLREPTDPQRLNGCGLVIANPPWRFEADARDMLAALLARLGDGEPGQGWAVQRLTEE